MEPIIWMSTERKKKTIVFVLSVDFRSSVNNNGESVCRCVCVFSGTLPPMYCILVFVQGATYEYMIVKQLQLFSDKFFSAEQPGHRGESRLGRRIDQRAGRDKQ